MTEDHLADIRPVDIPADKLRAWREQAAALHHLSGAVTLELHDLDLDPCPHRVRRAAKAARYVQSIAEEPQKTMAVALAEQLEAYAGGLQ